MPNEYVPLKVLGLAKGLVEQVYLLTNGRGFQKEAGLKNQVRRAAVSVPSNIIEGDARRYSRDGVRFFRIAIASAEEAKVQIELASKIGLIERNLALKIHEEFSVVCRMLNKLIQSRLNRDKELE